MSIASKQYFLDGLLNGETYWEKKSLKNILKTKPTHELFLIKGAKCSEKDERRIL